jgi:biopolymer transport protein TolR
MSLPPADEPGENAYQPLAQINVTPMVDVMLVLLVIFMVAAPLLSVGVPINLPKSKAAVITHPKKPIILSLNKEGEIFIGNEQVAEDDLKTRLAVFAAEDPERVVYVRADRSVTYAELMHTLGLVNHAGFGKVSLVAQADLSK